MKLLKTLKSLKDLKKSKLAKAVAMSLIVSGGVMGVSTSASAADDWYGFFNYKTGVPIPWTTNVKLARYSTSNDRVWDGLKYGLKYGIEFANRVYDLYNMNNDGNDVYNSNVKIVSGNIDSVFGGYSRYTVARNNKTEITGGAINCVYGGCSKEKYAKQNKVVVNGAGVKVGVIYGGYSQEGYVSANRAEVLSGSVSTVFGGYSEKKYVINGHAYISGGEAGTVYGGYSKKGETEESSAFMTGGKAETIYGGYSVDYNSHQNEAIVASGATAKNIYGGYSVNGHAYHNTAHLSEIKGTADSVYGGYSEKGDAYNNIVKLVRSSVYDVYGGYSAGGIAYGNTVNLYDGFTVKGGIYGGEGQSGSLANILNVYTENASAPKIGYFQTINFYADVANANSKMLTANDLSLCGIEAFNTNIDVEKYTLGKTITLLDTKDTAFIDKAKAAFKINGKKAEDVLINEKYSGVGVVAGYETTKNAINFTTMYKLLNDVNIAKDMDLAAYGLKLNGKTVNMQSDPGTTPEYNTLTAKKLIGNGNLKIDVDLAGGQNDKIQISGTDANDATVTLNSIIVRKDLPGEDDQELRNKVSVIEGNLDGIALKVGNGSISSSTSEYTYTFTKGTEAGKVNVTKEAADTIANFIQGKSKFKNLNSYTLTKSTTADTVLGITTRNEPCELNIAFNKDTSLSGKDNSKEKYDGISVYYKYTLKLQGEDESAPGTMTKFNTAVRNHGILEVENMNIKGNKADIDNRKTLNLNGTNTIGRIESEYGTTSLMSGKTTVDYLWQKELNVNAGELVLNGDAYAQTINISAGTVKGNITGRANNSTVTISDSTIEGDVYGGYASDTRETTNNVVNISGATVTGWVRGGSGFNDFTGNVLNVSGSESSAENIVHFAKINFTLSKDIKEKGVMLKLTDTLYPSPLGDPEINTTVTNENYTPGTTVTLLSNDIRGITRSNLKINDVEAEEATVATSMDGLSKNVNAIVGYEITDKAINFTTKSYELTEGTTDVTKDVTLNRVLNLNSATLNMQSDSDEKDSYKTLTVEKLSGTGNLAIDVDMATGESDKIKINEASDATINLNSIIVRNDLQEDPGAGEIKKENYVTVVDGKTGGTTLGLPNDSIKTATTKYVYKFTKGNDGKLNVDVERPGTFADFIPGTVGSVYENINTYTLTEDMAVEQKLGETNRVDAQNDKVITLAFNKGVSLSGLKVAESEESEESAKSVEGAIVKDTYTLKLQGEDAEAPGVMTQFKTAAVTNNGTLEVENMMFEGNDHDIINNGTLKLSGTNSIYDITNYGTANLYGKNIITTVTATSGKGTFNVEAGETAVSGEFEQNAVTVNGGTLALNGDINAKYLAVAKGSLEIGGALNGLEALTNAGTVVMNSDNTLPNVMTILTSDKETTGSFNVAAGKVVTVEGIIVQKDVNVNTNGKLLVKGNTKVTGTLKNAGTVSLNGSEIAMLNNNGIAELNGTNKLESVVGTGAFNVEKGTTTVNGAFVQKELNVTGGELVLNTPKDSFLAGEVQDHAVNITDGKVTGHVYGGASVDNAHENNVNITNGTITNDVYGGISYNGDAYKNTVNISGGEVKGDVFGALTINNGTAYANTVNISGGTINGNVYGGINEYGTNSSHHDNVINISGGKVVGTIFGASDKVESNNLLKVTGSNIEVGNIAYVQKLDFTLPAGYKNENALLVLTNTADKENEAQKTSLDLNGQGSIVVRSAPEERLEKGDVVTLIRKTNDKALEINDNGKFIFDDKGVLTKDYQKTAWYFVTPFNILKGNMQLVALDDDKIKNDLLFQVGNHILDGDEEKPKPIIDDSTPIPDPTPQPKPEPKPIDPDKPIVPVDPGHDDPVDPDDPLPRPDEPTPIIPVDPEPQPEPKPEVDPDPQPTPDPEPKPIDYDKVYGELMDNVKTALETRANGAALLNEAGDFLMKQGLGNAKMAAEQSKAEGDSSMAPFVALGGGKLRYETGSHVDSKSWHGAVGLAKQVNGLTFGVAIQQGKSNYDAYVNKAHSEGNSKSVGGALFAEKKIANGLHFDAAVRAGRVKNDYNANVTYSMPGANAFNVRYNESSAFYGISLGGGKEFTLKNKDKVDVYGRYAWTHTGSSEATTNWKDELKFDGINSHRILLGSRYTHAVNERNELYAGLGWQYELGGKVKGSIYGYSAPEPSLKGSSGLLELGWKAAAAENLTVDLNLSGWTGKQRGVMAGVNMQWKF